MASAIKSAATKFPSFSFLRCSGLCYYPYRDPSTFCSAELSASNLLLLSFNVSIVTSMIRLPPTSISLSESDVQLHFREINIYQSLLQQGFTRDAIQQYYASLEAPGSEGHASSQNPRFAITKNAKSNEDGSLPKRDHPASSRYLDKHTPWPAPPTADDSGEVVSTATGAQQSQQDRTSQAVPRKVEYAKVDSQKTAKQTAHKDRSEDTGSAHTDTDIVEISTSGNAESFAPSTVELRAGAKLGSKCFPDLPWDTSEGML